MPFEIDHSGEVVWRNPAIKKSVNKFLQELDANTAAPVVRPPQQTSVETTKKINTKAISDALESLTTKDIQPVDIILPVYGSLHVVEPCIKSVLMETSWPYHLTIVNDATPDGGKTAKYLQEIQQDYPKDITVITNKRNKGFAATVNRGIKNSSNPYICILNSDVVVTRNWLTKMVFTLESDPKIKMVNPMTNATALIEVPMHPGFSYKDMNTIMEENTDFNFPEVMPTGFCLLLERSLLQHTGLFDEIFENYGEDDLAINTPILTPKGWKTVNDINVGDKVYSLDGQSTSVIKTTKVMKNKQCYQITFDTGEKIIASATHKWNIVDSSKVSHKKYKRAKINHDSLRFPAWERRKKAFKYYTDGKSTAEVALLLDVCRRTAQDYKSQFNKGTLLEERFSLLSQISSLDKFIKDKKNICTISSVKTTEEMYTEKHFINRSDGSKIYKFWIPVTEPVEFPKQDLLLDPYILGLWLGDGTAVRAEYTSDDKELLDAFRQYWDVIKSPKTKGQYMIWPKGKTRNDRKDPESLLYYLVNLNLIDNKHIPFEYFFSSKEDRLALVQGLMDTDGHCTEAGKCTFDNANLFLIQGCAFLLRSLGIKCRVGKCTPKDKKDHHKQMYRVHFRTTKDFPVFRLSYKLSRLPNQLRPHRNFHRIIDIIPVESHPTKCISVGNDSHLFLAGTHLIPTHNSDLFMKTISCVVNGYYKKWKAALADNAYIFHERSGSFSSLGEEKHMAKRQNAASRFHKIWPNFQTWQKNFDIKSVLAKYKKPVPYSKNAHSNIAFVVHSTGLSGGMSLITDIVNEMNESDTVRAIVCLIKRSTDSPVAIDNRLRSAPIVFESYEDFQANFKEQVFDKGVVIAATTELLGNVVALEGQYKKGLFAQSDDLSIAPSNYHDSLKLALKNADFIISGSSWLDKKIRKDSGRKTLGYIKPGVDPLLFYNRGREQGDERPTVLFSLLSSYSFKGFNRGVHTAKALIEKCKKENKDIRIMAYGTLSVPGCPEVMGLGVVSQTYLADLLGKEVDVFCDPSIIHSYGLPSLEALASGVTTVCWDNKGINEYAKEAKNKAFILKEDASPEEVANKIYEELFKPKNRIEFHNQTRSNAIHKFISYINNEVIGVYSSKKINMITPHLRKHGGPTTILKAAELLKDRGHDIELYSIYSDINPEVIKDTDVPIRLDWKNFDECDVLVVNSDNEHTKFFSSNNKAKKKVLLKLSHNPRFQALEDQSLHLEWDNIITSTEWLKEVCGNPQPGWSHPSRKATRVGWYHYGHNLFKLPPTERSYGTLETGISIGFLAHQHPLKGTQEAMQALFSLKQKYGDKIKVYAFGEWPQFTKMRPPWVNYVFNPSRKVMAQVMKGLDIWVTSSHTEGLGRLSLEAMSAGCALVTTDTGAEFAEHENNCLITGKGNPKSIALAIERLIQDKILFQKLVVNGFATAEKYADPSDYIDKLEEVLCG